MFPIICHYTPRDWFLQQKFKPKTYFFHNPTKRKMYTITKVVKKGKTFLEFFKFWVVILSVLY